MPNDEFNRALFHEAIHLFHDAGISLKDAEIYARYIADKHPNTSHEGLISAVNAVIKNHNISVTYEKANEEKRIREGIKEASKEGREF